MTQGDRFYKESGTRGQLTCKRCGVVANRVRPEQMFCSTKCHQMFRRERVRPKFKGKCVHCLKDFESAVKSQKLCSWACQKRYSAATWNVPPREFRARRIAERHYLWRASRASDTV